MMIKKQLSPVRRYMHAHLFDFRSISDLLQFIESNDPFPQFERYRNDGFYGCQSMNTTRNARLFTETESFEEAKDLLLHGWEYKTKEIKRQLKDSLEYKTKQRTVYDVVGFQCSVPRYLQGIPTNMVNKKNIIQKNKVITINKCISYDCGVDVKEITKQSVKLLRLVKQLESQGVRINLNIVHGSEKNAVQEVVKVRIKTADQRLNLKQCTFPLIHPSMLRRIIISVTERDKECALAGFEKGYGYPINYAELRSYTNKGEYLIPAFIDGEEITDIEQYKVI